MKDRKQQEEIIQLLESIVPTEGVAPNLIEGVNGFRISTYSPRTPQSYEPGIIILAQGKKRVFIGDTEYSYDPMNFLVLSVPLPLECETTASAEEPMLGISISISPASIGEILLELEDTSYRRKSIPTGIVSAPLHPQILDATWRLLQAIKTPEDRSVLGPIYKKEIIYRVLRSPQGEALRAMAFQHQQFFQISRSLDLIHSSYDKKIDLKTLASEAGMSTSSFHTNFKLLTHLSPLQYIKHVKLHKARLLMFEEGRNASTAAYLVGYESPSQFSREYKRLFGLSPGKDCRA